MRCFKHRSELPHLAMKHHMSDTIMQVRMEEEESNKQEIKVFSTSGNLSGPIQATQKLRFVSSQVYKSTISTESSLVPSKNQKKITDENIGGIIHLPCEAYQAAYVQTVVKRRTVWCKGGVWSCYSQIVGESQGKAEKQPC